jgi:hypothetical protein
LVERDELSNMEVGVMRALRERAFESLMSRGLVSRRKWMLGAVVATAAVFLAVGVFGASAASSGAPRMHRVLGWDPAAAPRVAQVSPGAVLPGRISLASSAGQHLAANSGRDAIAAVLAAAHAVEQCRKVEQAFSRCGDRVTLHDAGVLSGPLAGSLQVLGSHSSYVISLTSSVGVQFTLDRLADGHVLRSCSPGGLGGCDARGAWS